MRRLLPEPTEEVAIQDLLGAVEAPAENPGDRPHVVSNFVLTLDGKATIGGSSGPIGSQRDTEMLVGLRCRAHAVMIGAGTMRLERYGPLLRDPAKRELRETCGMKSHPLAVIVSGRLDLPWDADMFTAGEGEVVVITTSDEDAPATATPVEVIRFEDAIDFPAALAKLRDERDVHLLLCEGGPHLHAELIQDDLVDELFVTHAPKLSGGEGPGLVAGLAEAERQLELEWLVTEPASGELFARYRVVRDE
jgi:riboflavin-specific deaminase-like protein